MKVTIWHNPACSKSRSVLAMLQQAGAELQIIEYLRSPLSRAQLAELIHSAGINVRDAIRQTDALYAQLGLDDPSLHDEQLLDAMAGHPALMNRPFVRTPLGTRLCRPTERLHEILPAQGGP